MNPVIYSIFNTEFREAFRKILTSYVRNECCNSFNRTNNDYNHRHNEINHRIPPNLAAMNNKQINQNNSNDISPRVSPGIATDRVGGGGIVIGSNNGGGQGVPTVKPTGSTCGKSSINKTSKNGHSCKDKSKVRRPLLPFYKRGHSEKKCLRREEDNIDDGRSCKKQSSNAPGAPRSCSLDTFPITNPSSKKSSSPLLTYSHVDIHTIDEHGGTISAI